MEKKHDILKEAGRRHGMTVPDGYFAEFASKMASSLPAKEYPVEVAAERSFWQKIRPYAYMAAMFAGIWCMLRMFNMMGGGTTDITFDGILDRHPGVVTALADDNFVRDYVYPDYDDYDIIEDLYEDGITPDEFFATEEETNAQAQ